ncbi:MAG: hypothetical protein ACOCQD_01885 [archaeon]
MISEKKEIEQLNTFKRNMWIWGQRLQMCHQVRLLKPELSCQLHVGFILKCIHRHQKRLCNLLNENLKNTR